MRVFHFMRYRWWFLGSLSAITLFGIILVFAVGLNFGIDFKGGVRMQVSLQNQATVNDVRSVVSGAGVAEPVVQSISGPSDTDSYLITAQEMTQEQQQAVLSQLTAKYGTAENATGVQEVGGSFSRATTNRAFIAVAIAVIAIIGYLSLRFEFKFAIPAIVALIHDLALTLGIYAAAGRVVTTATVAAILTILGYSVHDTIIVYDRINTLTMKRETYGDMVDMSIRQTMVRSINTAIAVLLPLVAILAFGGATLKDFALALTIGTASGAYSSFFVAAPLLTIWKEREPRYRKRLAVGAGVAVPAGAGYAVDVPGTPAVANAARDKVLLADAVEDGQGKAAISGKDGDRGPQQARVAGSGSRQKTQPSQGRVSQKPRKGKSSKRPAGKGSKRTAR